MGQVARRKDESRQNQQVADSDEQAAGESVDPRPDPEIGEVLPRRSRV